MHKWGRLDGAIYIVEPESHVVPKLDARESTCASLLADPRFWHGEVFRELLGGEEMGKGPLGARGAREDQLRDDLGFQGLERRGPFGDLFKGFTGLCAIETVGETWLCDKSVEREFG